MHGEEAAVEEEVSVDGKIFKVSVCRESMVAFGTLLPLSKDHP